MRARRSTSTRTVLRVAALCAGVLLVVGALAMYLAPRVLPNLQARVATVDTAEKVTVDGASATLTVPAGWVASRAWGEAGRLLVRSPDLELSVTLTVLPDAADSAFGACADSAAEPPETLGPAVHERLASGLGIVHADALERDALIAVIGADAGPGACVVARTPAERLPAYRAALAALVESVRVTP